jgi:hypothetical protein
MRETPVATERKVGAKRRRPMGSSSHNTPALCASSSRTVSSLRYASHLSAIHVDLHRVGCRQQQRGRWVGLCAEESCGGRGQLPAQHMGDSSRDTEGPIGGCDARRLGVSVHRLCLQSLRVGGIDCAPLLRVPRLLRPVDPLPRSLLPAPSVRCTFPAAHPLYVTPGHRLPTHSPTLSLSLALIPLHFAWFQWFLPCMD